MTVTDATSKFKAGQKVRITGNTNCSHFKLGDIATLVQVVAENDDGRVWLATSDPTVTRWDYKNASNVLEREIEPAFEAGDRVKGSGLWSGTEREGVVTEIEPGHFTIRQDDGHLARIKANTVELVEVTPPAPAFKEGDRVRRTAADHKAHGTNYEHREAAEGALGTITSVDFNGSVHVKWDNGRGSVVGNVEEALEHYTEPVVTLEDLTEAVVKVKRAETRNEVAQKDLTYYRRELDRVSIDAAQAATDLGEARDELDAALAAYKG